MLIRILGQHDVTRLEEARRANTRCHVPGNAERFSGLLPSLLMRHLISAERFQRGSTRAFQQGREVPLDMLFVRAGEHLHLRSDSLTAMCARGLSLVLNGIDGDVPAIGALNADIERQWRLDCWTNAYWSHGHASAFAPHTDEHSVLVLQLSGTKRWRCWGMPEPFPVASRAYRAADLPAPEWDGTLQPGDILFVPRGDIHAAELTAPSSLHLTVAVRPPRVGGVLGMLQKEAQADKFSRSDVPTQKELVDTAAVADWLRALAASLNMTEVLDRWDLARKPYHPTNVGIVVGTDTLFASTLRRRIPADHMPDGSYQITPGGWPFVLSATEWTVLERLHSAGAMTLGELTGACPSLDAKSTVDSLIHKSLLFALPPSEYGKTVW